MEITRLNIIIDFALPLTKVPQDFWKWGALLFAVFATCTSLFARIKLYILQLNSIKHSSLLPPHHHHHLFDQQLLNHNSDFSDDDDDNSTTDHEEFNSPLAYNVDEDEDDDDDDTINKVDQDFNVAGLHSTMSELFTTGKNVVKQWDNLDLGFQDKLTDDDSLCMYDTTIYENENIVYTSLTDTSNGVKLYVFDKRMRLRPRVPVIYAEWDSRLGKVECAALNKSTTARVELEN